MQKTKTLVLQETEGIGRLNTGEMATVAIGAIRKEAQARERQRIIQQRTAILDARDSLISYFFGRILEGGEQWKRHYDVAFSKSAPPLK